MVYSGERKNRKAGSTAIDVSGGKTSTNRESRTGDGLLLGRRGLKSAMDIQSRAPRLACRRNNLDQGMKLDYSVFEEKGTGSCRKLEVQSAWIPAFKAERSDLSTVVRKANISAGMGQEGGSCSLNMAWSLENERS